MALLQTILAFVVAIAVLVVIHELGHYLVARWSGVKVLRFSFGFGRVLWSRRAGKDNTEWAICAFPLGGYVKMLDEREGDVVPARELHRAFNQQSVWVRSLIVLAGPVANFLLAIAVYWVLFMTGQFEVASVVGSVQPNSAAQRAGLNSGDRVVEAGGKALQSWGDLRWAVIESAIDGATLSLTVQSADGARVERRLELQGVSIDDRQPDPMQQIGLRPPMPQVSPIVGRVLPGSPAEKAGIQLGDRIVSLDDVAIPHFQVFADTVAARSGRTVPVRVERDGKVVDLTVSVEPVAGSQPPRGRVGIEVKPDPQAQRVTMTEVFYGPVNALSKAMESTWATTAFSLKVMWRMLRGDVSLSNVSGPLTIADYAGKSARAGLDSFVSFIALVSISLGVLNLLPVPLLDGGHLLYYLAEIIRGKPLSEHVMELGQRIGFVLLGCLMLLAFFNDINRQFSGLG
ncbi:MAG: RIP metalloprotease RseP [Rhodocyclaceae bacterium]